MTDSPFECFMADVFDEIQKRYIESQKDMSKNQNDLFISGRALAYTEIYEIIKNQMDIYGVTIDQTNNTTE